MDAEEIMIRSDRPGQGSCGPRWGTACLAAGALLAWCGLVLSAGHFAINLALRVWAARDGLLPGYRAALLVSWKTTFLAFLLLAAAGLGRLLLRAASRRGLPRASAAGLLAAAGLLSLCALAVSSLRSAPAWCGSNRWGFPRVFVPNRTMEFDPKNGEVPLLHLSANSESYRDDEWTFAPPAPGTVRVLLAGDSTVAGLSIPDQADLLDKQLEKRLDAAGRARWEVWNLANAPASLWYFCEAVLRAAPEARARYAVLFVYAEKDIVFLDEQKALADKPAWFYPLALRTGLLQDLLAAAHNPWPRRYEADASVAEAQLAQFERLLEAGAAQGLHVIVWEAAGPYPQFDPYRGRPGVTFLDWRRSVGLSCGDDPKECRFYRDPAFGYPSGHLTPKGFALVADALAPVLLRLEQDRGRR